MKQKSFTLDASPYNIKIKVHLTKQGFKKETRCSEDEIDGDGCTWTGCDPIVVGVFDNKIETLVHEMSHAVVDVFDHIGQPICKQSEEAFAYLLGNLVGKAAKKITKLAKEGNNVRI